MIANNEIFNKKQIRTAYMYLYIFLMLLLCRDSLVSTTILGFPRSFFLTLIISIPNFIIFIKKIKEDGLKSNRVYIFIILVLSIILTMIIKSDYQLYNFSLLVFIFIGFVVSYAYDYKEFIKAFINIMIFISVYSLITTYLFKPLITHTGINFPTIINSVNNVFYNFIFSFALTAESYIRNFGFFREPGVYQVFIILALIFLTFVKNINIKCRTKIIYTLIFTVTILSTFSTTGIILLALFFTTYIVKLIRDGKMNRKVFIIITTITIICILILTLLYNIIPSFRETLRFSIEKIFTPNESLSARQESIIVPLKLYLNSPIFGQKYIDVVEAIDHNTNTTINMFAIYGLLTGVIHIMLIYLLIKKMKQPKSVSALIFIIFIVAINTQFLIGNSVLWIVMFSCFMEDKTIPKKENYIER